MNNQLKNTLEFYGLEATPDVIDKVICSVMADQKEAAEAKLSDQEIALRVLQFISEHTGVSISDIKGGRRYGKYVEARKLASVFIPTFTTISFGDKQICDALGGLAYGSLYNYRVKVKQHLETEPKTREAYTGILNELSKSFKPRRSIF